MQEVWFISDTHFGHKNILTYEAEARPFNNVTEMNEAIITRWNATIRPCDKVFHLGDFCFGRANIAIAQFLHGAKILVLGNHDRYPMVDYLQYFHSVHGYLFWNGCLLSHIPIHSDSLADRAIGNIHGHLHSKSLNDTRYYNVSCERNNLTPINASAVLDAFKLT